MIDNTEEYDEQLLNQLGKALKHPQTFSETFLMVPTDGDPQPFRALHPQKLIYNTDKLVTYICIHRRGGKCLVGSSKVIDTATLKPVSIQNATHLTQTFGFDFQQNKVIPMSCQWKASGTKPTLKISLGSGQHLAVTYDELLFDWKRGWVEAQQLRVGDRILGPSELPIFGDYVPTVAELERLVNDTVFGEIHDSVYKLTKECLCKYLHGVWSRVGRLLPMNGLVSFILQEVSLAYELQHLLLRIGVSSKVDKEGDLIVYDPIDISIFLSSIGFEYQVIDIHSPRRWDIVTEVSRGHTEDVFDLVIDHPDRNFICNNCVVHNSFSLASLSIFHAITAKNQQIRVFVPASDQLSMFFGDVDKLIDNSDFVLSLKSDKGNTKEPQVRSFVNGSVITGHLLGSDAILAKNRRGLGGHVIFVDEAQALTEEHWRVLSPIISGDPTKFGKVKTYVAGTITLPPGPFYKKVFNFVEKGWCHDHEKIVYLPVTKNPEITAEMLAQYRADCASEDAWNTEWLLKPGALQHGVFRADDVAVAGDTDYTYGPHLIEPNHIRFITVDWDKTEVGTNIVVSQYHPEIQKEVEGVIPKGKSLKVIYREEVEKGPYTLTNATKRVLELADEYTPQLILADSGMGENQIEELNLATGRAHLMHLQGRIVRVNFGAKKVMFDPNTGEEIKPSPAIKEYIIGLLKRMVNEHRLIYAASDTLIAEQLLSYKEISRTDTHVKYTRDNEHIIDCLAMACYGLELLLGSEYDVIPMLERTRFDFVSPETPNSQNSEYLSAFQEVLGVPRDFIGDSTYVYKMDFDSVGRGGDIREF